MALDFGNMYGFFFMLLLLYHIDFLDGQSWPRLQKPHEASLSPCYELTLRVPTRCIDDILHEGAYNSDTELGRTWFTLPLLYRTGFLDG